MDGAEIKVEMAEEGLLEPLVITEEGDIADRVTERGAASGTAVIIQSCSVDVALNKEDKQTGEDKNDEKTAGEMCLEEQNLEKQQVQTEQNQTGEVGVDEKDKPQDDNPEETENINDGQNKGDTECVGQKDKVMRINEKPEKPSDEEEGDTQNDFQVAIKKLNFCEQQREATGGQEDDSKGVCNLSFLPFSCTLVSPVLVTHLAGRAVNSVQCCCGKTAGSPLLLSMWEYRGVE